MFTREGGITINFADRYAEVRRKVREAAIKSGRDPRLIKIIGVTKTVDVERIKEAFLSGLKDFGENRLQEAEGKIAALPNSVNWHFIGRLQTNKARKVARLFRLIHSLDRFKLASFLAREGQERGKSVPVLVQVNIGKEKTKAGLDPEEVKDFIEDVSTLPGLKICGLMGIAPFLAQPEEVRPYFRSLKLLFDQIKIPGVEMKYLSMGMSNDFEVAVEEGANLLRIGTALFGERRLEG